MLYCLICFITTYNMIKSENTTNTKLYEIDLENFDIQWITENQVSKKIRKQYKNHNIFQDNEYTENKQYYDDLIRDYEDIVENDIQNYEGLLYGKLEDKFVLYTDVDIKNGTIIGQVTGVITKKNTVDFLHFIYPSIFNNDTVYLECHKKTNIFSYAQKILNGNVDIVNYPHKDKWLFLVIANKDIKKDQQISLTVDYDMTELQDLNMQSSYTDISEGRLLSNQDLHLFNVTYLEKNIIEDQQLEQLLKHNIYDSEYFQKHLAAYDLAVFLYYEKIMQLEPSENLIYIKFVNNQTGYGVFAKKRILQNQIIGEYTGIVQKSHSDQSAYAWLLRATFPEQNYDRIVIGSKEKGNIFRFVNDYDDHNVQGAQLPINNEWRIFYQATKDIEIDQELSVNYGESYWSMRKKFDNTKEL